MRKITHIIVHCSDSLWGDVEDIRQWHTLPVPKGRGWNDVGYHYVIANAYPDYNNKATGKPNRAFDGLIQIGRPLEIAGSHVTGMNASSVGICLVGRSEFTAKQFDSLVTLLNDLRTKFSVPIENILGHCDTPTGKAQGKSCPNFDVGQFVKDRIK